MEIATRPLTDGDLPELTALLRANRAFLAPWEPLRDDDFFTEAGQAALLHGTGPDTFPRVILVDGRIAGRVTLSNVVRGPFRSGSLGYWVAQEHNGRGVATAVVGQIVRYAFGDLGLHRVEAGTLVHNIGSQRVLQRNGFTRFGLAPKYLRIAGHWQDHVLFQRVDEPG